MRHPFSILLLITCGLTIGGCASQGALDNVRNDVDGIKTRLFSVERDLAGIRQESKEGVTTLEKGVKGEVASVRKLSADIQATIDSTKSEMQALNGKLDDTFTALKKPTEELNRYRDDADKRILALEDRILKLMGSVDELTRKNTDLAAQLLLIQQQKKKDEQPAAPDALYMKGLETFKAGDMPTARDQFTKFLEQNPQHDLAANAHYWIGETYYSEKNYEPAILAFQEVIKNYPNKEKIPASMLKQAMAFSAIKDTKSAKYVLKKLVEGAPKSEEAKKARELLKEIK